MRLGFRTKLTLATSLVVALAVLFSLALAQHVITGIHLQSLEDRSVLNARLAEAHQETVTFSLRSSTLAVTRNVRILAALADMNYGQLYFDLDFEFSKLREAAEALELTRPLGQGEAVSSVPPGGIFRYVRADGPPELRVVPPPAAINAGEFPQDAAFLESLFRLLSPEVSMGERSAHLAVGGEAWWVLGIPVLDDGDITLRGWIVLAQPDPKPLPIPDAGGYPTLNALRVGAAWSASDGFSPAQRVQVAAVLDAREVGAVSAVELDRDWRLYARPMPSPGLPTAWRVLLFNTRRLQNDLEETRSLALLLGAGLMGAAICLAWLLSHNLARPLIRLRDATKAVERGDFSVRVPVPGTDEFGQLTESFNQMTSELALKERYKSVLDKVTDPGVARRLVHGEISLGGELRTASVLFCDIRGFTKLTEGMNPADVITMLNEHMTALTKIAAKHKGMVDKFSGDEIMVVFGAPESYGDDTRNAALCALEMVAVRERMNDLNPRPIEVGIGIATGEVVAGCMGSADRLNYTVLGARVNLGARLCGKAKAMEILVDEATRVALGKDFTVESLPEMELKGFTLAHFVHRLAGEKQGVQN